MKTNLEYNHRKALPRCCACGCDALICAEIKAHSAKENEANEDAITGWRKTLAEIRRHNGKLDNDNMPCNLTAMKQITINLYEYSELSDQAKAKARDWFRSTCEGDNYFAESVEEDARQCFSLVGFSIDKLYWSGFSCQGDGACFTGSWSASDVKPGKLKIHAPVDAELHRIAKELEAIAKEYPDASMKIEHCGRYYHSHSTSMDIVMDDTMDEQPSGTATASEYLKELARDAMDWIYQTLEKEYNYTNSDEQIEENIKANEYTFTIGGERKG